MNIRIALGTGLLLTVGTAVAGSFIYGHGKPAATMEVSSDAAISATAPVTPEMIAMWQAQAGADNYIAPKVPI
ncbi:MAG: hypothetical protein ACREXP_10005 [Steroidobacteraceae bacterium]